MRLENMRDEFPQMPEEMRKMVEWEVARQMKIERPLYREEKQNKRGFSGKRLAMFGLAATLCLGLTAAAGSRIYQMYSEKEGNYGVKTGVTATGTTTDTIPEVEIQVGYLPETLYECADLCGPGKYHCKDEETPHTTGVTLVKWVMDSEGDLEAMQDTNVVEQTEMEINGHEAVYLKKQFLSGGGTNYSRVLYILYPEVQHIVQMYVSDGVPEEEMIKMAESIELVPTGEVLEAEDAYTWNDYALQQEDTVTQESKYTASLEEMANLHSIGEEIPIEVFAQKEDGEWDVMEGITVKVADVQVADDLSLLTASEYVDEKWKEAIGDDGKLEMDTVQYVKHGDGVNTIDEVVKTEEKAQKLVYVTLEYTNTSDQELQNVLFFHSMLALEEQEEGYAFREWVKQQEDGTWDEAVSSSVTHLGEMGYYDVHGGERANNYISDLQPGETAAVHIACIAHEEDLPYLYLNLVDSSYEFGEKEMEVGYVDIRQNQEY